MAYANFIEHRERYDLSRRLMTIADEADVETVLAAPKAVIRPQLACTWDTA